MPKGEGLLPGGNELSLDAPVTKTSSRLDVAGASFQLSWKHAETSSFLRMANKHNVDNKEDVEDHDLLNQEYRLPIPLNKPTSRAVFDLLVEEDMERKELAGIIQNGKKDGLNTAITFMSGMGAQVSDPFAFGAGVATGTIFTRMAVGGLLGAKALKATAGAAKARKTLQAAKAAAKVTSTPATLAAVKLAKKGVEATAPGLGRRMGEGVVGNVVGELALVVPSTNAFQQDVDVAQNVWNAVGGGIAFPAMLKSMKMTYATGERLYNSVAQRMNAGKVPFGNAREIELTTGEVRKALDEELKVLIDAQIKDQKILNGESIKPPRGLFDGKVNRKAPIEDQLDELDGLIDEVVEGMGSNSSKGMNLRDKFDERLDDLEEFLEDKSILRKRITDPKELVEFDAKALATENKFIDRHEKLIEKEMRKLRIKTADGSTQKPLPVKVEVPEGHLEKMLEREAVINATQSSRDSIEVEVGKETEIRANANADDQNVYHSEEAKTEHQLYKEKKEAKVPVSEEAQQALDKQAVEDAYRTEEALAGEEGKLAVTEAKEKAKTMRDSVKDAYDKAADCVRGIVNAKK